MVNNYANINKTKESLNSDGQQLRQHQQNKRKFKQNTTSHLNSLNTTKREDDIWRCKSRSIPWDRHKYMAGLNQLMGSQPTPLDH